MVDHYKDPGPFKLDIQENIDERIVSGFNLVLPMENPRCRNIGVGIVKGMIRNIGSKLSIQCPVGSGEPEKMFKISC